MTDLTYAQHSRLDRIAAEDPAATVIAWEGGPVIRRGDGRLQRLRNTGRVTAMGREQNGRVG